MGNSHLPLVTTAQLSRILRAEFVPVIAYQVSPMAIPLFFYGVPSDGTPSYLLMNSSISNDETPKIDQWLERVCSQDGDTIANFQKRYLRALKRIKDKLIRIFGFFA
jgi:hypothetical protein